MSFVQLDDREFPKLGTVLAQEKTIGKVIKRKNQHQNGLIQKINIEEVPPTNVPQESQVMAGSEQLSFSDTDLFVTKGDDFVAGRVGLNLNDYHEDLAQALRVNRVGADSIDFLLAHIEPIRGSFYDDQFEGIPDFVLPNENVWSSRIAVQLEYPSLETFYPREIERFQRILEHALYLHSPVVVIPCPSSDLALLHVASIINSKLEDLRGRPSILIRVPAEKTAPVNRQILGWEGVAEISNSRADNEIDTQPSQECDGSDTILHNGYSDDASAVESNSPDSGADSHGDSQNIQTSNMVHRVVTRCHNHATAWSQWDALRCHLVDDRRIGVCIALAGELDEDREIELDRWLGEPVRMVIISTDLFVKSPGNTSYVRLSYRYKAFLKKLAVANSLKISFVLEAPSNLDTSDYTRYLRELLDGIKREYPDRLRPWDDKLQTPLQPLSMNLTSGTYSVFESDRIKYTKYREAMIQALRYASVRSRRRVDERVVLMVLGAGRGPLVDMMIEAIRVANLGKKYKVFVLDKNPSSVRSLKYKQRHHWLDATGTFEVEVVEADMRAWEPGVAADIIVSELLGSLGDNELSPECIDGVHRFSTPETISIPQSYSSYIGPICSQKLRQRLWLQKTAEGVPAYDQIYVTKLTNYYAISQPRELFTFFHTDLTATGNNCNQRYKKLYFISKVDTVCHGFAGYFSARLFGDVSISTLPSRKTPSMDSWFPAFIPLSEPVRMPARSAIEVHFWRKESNSQVWYEWALTKPIRSRLHSPNGLGTAMSKFL